MNRGNLKNGGSIDYSNDAWPVLILLAHSIAAQPDEYKSQKEKKETYQQGKD